MRFSILPVLAAWLTVASAAVLPDTPKQTFNLSALFEHHQLAKLDNSIVLPQLDVPPNLEKRDQFPNQIIYASDCWQNGYLSSELDYYFDWRNSNNGQHPDDQGWVTYGYYSDWKEYLPHVSFQHSSVYVVWQALLSHPQNGIETIIINSAGSWFYCYAASGEQLFTANNKYCWAQHICFVI
jgi:hypothetical protein